MKAVIDIFSNSYHALSQPGTASGIVTEMALQPLRNQWLSTRAGKQVIEFGSPAAVLLYECHPLWRSP